MVKIYKQPFAHGGDAIAIPDASQPDGKMSSADGWTPDYQLPKTDPNYKPVGRQEMNGVFKEVTEALGQVQVQGAASWSAAGAPYPINAQVYHNGKQWLALRANSVSPVEGEDWAAVGPQKTVTDAIATKADKTTQVIAGTGLTGGGTLAADRTLSIANSYIPIGAVQTWQNVLGSRAIGTTYTNSTGRPIEISVTVRGQSGGFILYVAGIAVAQVHNTASSAVTGQMDAVIPAGDAYRLDRADGAASILTFWAELR